MEPRRLEVHCSEAATLSGDFAYQRSDLGILTVAAPAETFDHAGAVARVAVLAHLALGFEAGDGKPQADDPPGHRRQIGLRCVAGRPRQLVGCLLLLSQL